MRTSQRLNVERSSRTRLLVTLRFTDVFGSAALRMVICPIGGAGYRGPMRVRFRLCFRHRLCDDAEEEACPATKLATRRGVIGADRSRTQIFGSRTIWRTK
jgi:hypothetical protein